MPNGPNILLIDDEPMVLSALSRQLGDHYNIYTAESGPEALKLLESGKAITAVICDMRMPGMDGAETLIEISKRSPNTIRMMLTGNSDQQTAVDVINRCGIFRFFTKPCRVEDLIKGINDAVKLYSERSGDQQFRNTLVESLMNDLITTKTELERMCIVAAHDLREPVRLISSYAQLLSRSCSDRLNDEERSYVEQLVTESKRIHALVGGMLDYARSTATDRPQPVSADEACRLAADNLSPLIKRTGAKVEVGPLPEVMADIAMLEQIFENLIGNAIKFRHHHRIPEVRISGQVKERKVEILVEDNGIGFNSRSEDVFNLFFKQPIKAKLTPSTGLAICKRLINRMRGKITARSALGEGSVFTIILPAPHIGD